MNTGWKAALYGVVLCWLVSTGWAALAQTNRLGAAQVERESALQSKAFALFADSAWVAAERGNGDAADLREESFRVLQDAMAGTASEAITRMAARRFADETASGLGSIVRERETLDAEWTTVSERYAQTFGNSSPASIDQRSLFAAERATIETRLNEIEDRLRRDFPEYFALINPEAMTIGDAQQMLRQDEALLLVVPSEFGTHVIALTAEDVKWAYSEWNDERMTEAVRRLRWYLGASVDAEWAAAQPSIDPGVIPFDRGTAHALYRELILPVSALLENKRKLFIAAGGVLSAIPFSVLVSATPEGDDADPDALRSTHWFADDFALTHIPSIRSLQLLRAARQGQAEGGRESFAGYGDPVLLGSAQRRGLNRGATALNPAPIFSGLATRDGGTIADVAALRQLARLPGTAVELQNMGRALGADAASIHLADQATENAVRSADLSGVSILAFATHGLTGGDLEGLYEPGLVFTPPAQASEQDDGYLAASEVSTLRLDADWVILSACNTASGEGPEAAGLSDLARAFFYAGAHNLLASHWPVDDTVASRLTVRTIEMESSGSGRAAALQQAMREIRMDAAHDDDQSWAHPYFWAPFTLIGDGG